MHEFGDGYKAIAPSREMLPMDPGSERAIVSTPIDSRREVALQVLRVSVETAHIVSIFARDGIDLCCKRCWLKMPPWCRFCPTCGSKQV